MTTNGPKQADRMLQMRLPKLAARVTQLVDILNKQNILTAESLSKRALMFHLRRTRNSGEEALERNQARY